MRAERSTETATFTFVVPVRSLEQAPPALAAIGALIYPPELVEVLVVSGSNPSIQRNEAAACASGEYIYFVDDDALVDELNLEYLATTFTMRPDVHGIGGPSVHRQGDTGFQRSVATAMGSVFGLGPVRHRFYPSGPIRGAGENELILCNLAVRRSRWAEDEGFDPRLYPNEENEYINRVTDQGARFLYHPLVMTFRSPRRTLWELVVQNVRYGIGRAMHFRLRPKFVSALLLLPSLLVLYCLGLLVGMTAMATNGPTSFAGGWRAHEWSLVPLAMYLNLLASASLFGGLSTGQQKVATFARLLVIFPAIHLSYGTGMILGRLLRHPVARPAGDVRVVRVKELRSTTHADPGAWPSLLTRVAPARRPGSPS